MFWRDHNTPHFHALYGEYEAVFDMRKNKGVGNDFFDRISA
jgi:hypothetical protein